MKKTFFKILMLLILISIPFGFVRAEDLSKKMSGKILLQVESHGEAWYVNPANLNRYYMADGNAAYNVMRNLGVGITNSNLAKLQNNKNLAKKQSGKIFLQVEDKGQAYYVNFDGTFYYLRDGSAAYNIMRNLGLGINNNDLYKIPEGVSNKINNSNIKSSSLKPIKLTDIIKEWRKSTAFVLCYWTNPSTHRTRFTMQGSGLLFMLAGIPTVLTNKHVVYDSTYGMPNECDVSFPEDNKNFYTIHPIDQPAYIDPEFGVSVPDSPAYGTIDFLKNNYDIATLSNFKLNSLTSSPPALSLNDRAVDGEFSCKRSVDIGESIVILGYPSYGSGAGAFTLALYNPELTATEGIISGNDGSYYTTSAKIEHGNSGGLAIDETNDCYIGIPTASYTGAIESLGRILPASSIFSY